jgi:ribosomal protein L11 methyltransferase
VPKSHRADNRDMVSNSVWPGAAPGFVGPQPSGWVYRLSPHLVLCTRWQPPRSGSWDRVLWLKSGEAFSPGHPTGRLCLDLLREALAARSVQSLLDVGCGSGLLGLAAAALGVPRVVGVDISPAAARVTRRNSLENGLGGEFQVVQGSTECIKGPFDLVIANLPWEIQMDKVLELHRLGACQGRLIISGFRDNQEDSLIERYRQRGWSLQRRGLWVFRHPELPPNISFNWVAWVLTAAAQAK